jgi:hypothetical protein
MKAHKEVPQLRLTKDDAELVVEKVQDQMEKLGMMLRSRGRRYSIN